MRLTGVLNQRSIDVRNRSVAKKNRISTGISDVATHVMASFVRKREPMMPRCRSSTSFTMPRSSTKRMPKISRTLMFAEDEEQHLAAQRLGRQLFRLLDGVVDEARRRQDQQRHA